MSDNTELLNITRMRLLVVRALMALFILAGLILEFVDLGRLSSYSGILMAFGFGAVVATLALDPKQWQKS